MIYENYTTEETEKYLFNENCCDYIVNSQDESFSSETTSENKYFDLTSSGSQKETLNYLFRLPDGINVLREVRLPDCPIQNHIILPRVFLFVSIFQEILQRKSVFIHNSINLPPLKFMWQADGSVLIEWIFKDFRIGFSIEPQDEESGWYLVSNKVFEESSKSGLLEFDNLALLLDKLINFAIENS